MSRISEARKWQPSGFMAVLLRLHRWLRRTLEQPRYSRFLLSNLVLIMQPRRVLKYIITLLAFYADSPHLARRVPVIDSERSRLFLRPLEFFLATSTILGIMVVVLSRRFAHPIANWLPEPGWQRTLVFGGLVLVSPLAVALLSAFLKLPALLASPFIPTSKMWDPEIWWAIFFLLDPRTWARTRRPNLFQYLLFAGPYVLLATATIGSLALLPLHALQRYYATHPGKLSSEGSVFVFHVLWAGMWALFADFVVVNRFAAGLPMLMSSPTYAMTRMVIPKLHRNVGRLKRVVDTIHRYRSTPQVYRLLKLAAEPLVDLEIDVAVYRTLRFPFRTDFIQLYDMSLTLERLADVYVEESAPRVEIARLREVLSGTAPTRAELGGIRDGPRAGSGPSDRASNSREDTTMNSVSELRQSESCTVENGSNAFQRSEPRGPRHD